MLGGALRAQVQMQMQGGGYHSKKKEKRQQRIAVRW